MTELENELARAMARVSGAVNRIERAVAASQRHQYDTVPGNVNLLRQEAQALRDVQSAVASRLGHTIERLRNLVEEATGGRA